MKRTIIYKGYDLEVRVNPDCHKMALVTVREIVRPTWKIFRTRYLGSGTFWVEDYKTIEDGALAIIEHIIQKMEKDDEIAKKWKDFEKEGLID